MFYEIKGTQASSLCFSEKEGMIYIGSSHVKSTVFPNCDQRTRISSARHMRLQLSDNRQYLAMMNAEYCCELYNTADTSKPLFVKRWKDAAAANSLISFFQDRELLIPVQNVVYALNLQNSLQLKMIYGDPDILPDRSNWPECGNIISISTFNDEVVILHRASKVSYETRVIRMKGKDHSIVSIQELPVEMRSTYERCIYDQKGGVCLFSRIDGRPMLYYKAFPTDFLKPDAIIQLPCISGTPMFSTDGKYLTFQAYVKDNIYPEGWLIDTSNWQTANAVRDRLVLSPSFSSDNHYWLVPGKKPLIFELK